MNNSAAEVEELDEDLVRRAKEKVGELFNCHVNKLSQTIVAGHLATVHKVVFKIALNMVEEFDGKKGDPS